MISHDLLVLRKALRVAFEADQPASVIVISRLILKHKSDDAMTWMRLGHSLSETAQYEEAEIALHKSLELCELENAFIV
jgi:cytochrome c-type biogenesis protein CcmH/NrfG